MAEIIDERNFNEKVLKSKVPVIVDFYANWCGPCNEMITVVDEFEKKHKDVSVFKVDVDKNIELAEKYNVLSVPTFMIFKNGVKSFSCCCALSMPLLIAINRTPFSGKRTSV